MSQRAPARPLDRRTAHLCVDMQRMFAEETPWHAPWVKRVLPRIERLVAAHPERTIFTRFIPAKTGGHATGAWQRYYERWAEMTLERLDPGLLDLVPELARFTPPAAVVDKNEYSSFRAPDLEPLLRARGIETLIVTGVETDVCVLATILAAVDAGYHVIVPTDAICSSSDETHDALLKLYRERFGEQIEPTTVDAVLARWP